MKDIVCRDLDEGHIPLLENIPFPARPKVRDYRGTRSGAWLRGFEGSHQLQVYLEIIRGMASFIRGEGGKEGRGEGGSDLLLHQRAMIVIGDVLYKLSDQQIWYVSSCEGTREKLTTVSTWKMSTSCEIF